MTDLVRFAPGTLLAGKYRVEREIASGGMGVVLAAQHERLGQRVAIKVLHGQYARRRETVERFEREARLAASLRSEHVVRIHDVSATSDGIPYIVMEYLEGEDLGAIVSRGPVAPAVAVDWILQACEALSEAHALGIVHRDLKPDNLFLVRRGPRTKIKIVDFGISKAGSGARITTENDRFGTPVYMAPEQLQSSSDVDARTDIWALGVVLFELLTQRVPWDGEELPELIAHILTREPRRVREHFPALNPGLDALIARCLVRDRAGRPQTVDELADALAEHVEVVPASVRANRAALAETMETPDTAWVPIGLPSPRPRRLARGVAAGAAACVAALGIVLAANRPTSAAAAGLVAPPPAASTPVVVATASPPEPVPAPSGSVIVPVVVAKEPPRPPARKAAPAPARAPAPAPRATSDYDGFGERR